MRAIEIQEHPANARNVKVEMTRIGRKTKSTERQNGFFEFSFADHLWVQRRVEKRASELARDEAESRVTALECWARAEREVLDEFCDAYAHKLRA
jgi:hypothetical protein